MSLDAKPGDPDRYWGGSALDRWKLFGPPLRPAEQDGQLFADAVRAWAARNGTPRIVVLGSTPEIQVLAARHGWPVCAVDRARPMLRHVWPGSPGSACCADWTRLPLAAGSQDIAFLDGGLQMLTYPDGQARFARELAHVLRPGGLFVVRVFVLPQSAETTQQVVAALRAGEVSTPDELRLRLWMAVQESPAAGVALRQVWEALSLAAPDFPAVGARLGWSDAQVGVVNDYANAVERYYLTRLDHIADVFRPCGFELEAVRVPAYAMGQCCPTLVLRRQD